MTNVGHPARLAMNACVALAVLASATFGGARSVDADSMWWGGIFQPVSDGAKAVTGKLELSPDYIFFIFGKDVGVQWQEVSCSAKSCLFQVMDPKPVSLKDGKSLCPGGKAVHYIQVKRAGGREYSVSYLETKSAASACLTATYRQ